MVFKFLQVAVVPAVVALVAVWLVHRYEKDKLRIEQDENTVRQLFDRNVNALAETYEVVSECFDTLNRFGNSPPKSAEEFKKEGIIRKGGFTNGRFLDTCLLGILKEEWKEPKILT